MKSKNEQFENDPVNFTKLFSYGYNHHTSKTELLPLFEFEEKIIEHIHKNRFSIINKSRQMHLTTLLAAYVTWKLVYEKKNFAILFFSHNGDSSKRFKQMVRQNIDHLPEEILDKNDIITNNAKEIVLKNGNFLMASAPSKCAGKNTAVDLLIFDECAYIPFLDYIYPTTQACSAAKNGKIIMVSSPNFEDGLFYETYTNAISQKNNYSVLDVHWTENPLYRVGFAMENGISTSDWYKQACLRLGSQENIDAALNLKFRKPPQNKTSSIAIRLEKSLIDEIQRDMYLKGITNLSDYIRQAISEKLKKS